MKEIKLSKGKVAIVDDEDYHFLNQWKWTAHEDKYTFYAIRKDYTNGKHNAVQISMHRLILGLTNRKQEAEHIDRNGLNNQRSNLRVATRSQNCSNRKLFKNSKSKLKGVSFHNEKWRATICLNKKCYHIGYFKTKEDAALAYNKKAKELHGEFSCLN